jgi:molybdopterin/thiamine biosynthesis adenylyltransferase
MTADLLARRYARHERLRVLGPAAQAKLSGSCAAVVGLGALGSVSASTLARAGVGRLILIDRDLVEPENLQGQVLYDEEDVAERTPKAVAAARRLTRINGSIAIEPRAVDLTPRNVADALAGAQVVVDGTDNFETRYLVNDHCVKAGLPWVYAGAIAQHGQVMPVRPGVTACLRCLLPELPPPGSYGTCDTDGILAPVSQVIANLEAVEALKLLTGQGDACVRGMLAFDGWHMDLDVVQVPRAPSCPACVLGRFDWLEGAGVSDGIVLCGRDAVQVPGRPGVRLAFDELGPRLASLGRVRWNEHLLRLSTDEYDISLFPDARAIIKGTTDPGVARSLYSRYFGM